MVSSSFGNKSVKRFDISRNCGLGVRNMKLTSVEVTHQRIRNLIVIYQRFFSTLSLNVDVVNPIGTNVNDSTATNKCPFILLLFFVFLTSVFVIGQLLVTIPISQFQSNLSFCFIVFSLFAVIRFPMVHSIFYYHDVHVIWRKVDEIVCLALKELQFVIFFRSFLETISDRLWNKYNCFCH